MRERERERTKVTLIEKGIEKFRHPRSIVRNVALVSCTEAFIVFMAEVISL